MPLHVHTWKSLFTPYFLDLIFLSLCLKPTSMPPLSSIWSKHTASFTISWFYNFHSNCFWDYCPSQQLLMFANILRRHCHCSAPHRPTQATTDSPSPPRNVWVLSKLTFNTLRHPSSYIPLILVCLPFLLLQHFGPLLFSQNVFWFPCVLSVSFSLH